MTAILKGEAAREYMKAGVALLLGMHNHATEGGKGVRDSATLEKIVYDSMKFSEGFDLASHFLYEIATKHPFWDGNKRTALLSASAILSIQYLGHLIGSTLTGKPKPHFIDLFDSYSKQEDKKLIEFMLDVAKGKHTRKSVLNYLKQKLKGT